MNELTSYPCIAANIATASGVTGLDRADQSQLAVPQNAVCTQSRLLEKGFDSFW